MEFRYQTFASYSYVTRTVPIFEEDLRSVPFFISSVVLAIQLLHICVKIFRNGRMRSENTLDRISRVGGKTIFIFMVTRLVGSIILLGLSLYTVRECKFELGDLRGTFRNCPELFLTVTFVYTTFLSLVSLLSTAYGTWSTRYNVVVLLSVWGVYAYRDVWPLATYRQQPADSNEGLVLPIKIVILTWTALCIPLFIPRRYIPLDPNSSAVPNNEQTASIFSKFTFTFVDRTILLGYRTPRLTVDQMDPLSDRDAAAYRTKKAFPHLDVFHGAKRRSLFWGLLRVYRKDYIILVFTIVAYSLSGFAAPIGINRVLYYMETGGAGATIRPWFWALWLFAGPMIQSFSIHQYLYLTTRILVRAEGLITQLVFEHSLRIRLKGETSKANPTPAATPAESPIATPDNASLALDAASEESEGATHETLPSQESTVVSRDPSTTSTVVPSKSTSKAKAVSKPAASTAPKQDEGAKDKEESADSNLIGKINNLVTTDLNNITTARDFLMIILYIPLQITLCMVFLYQVLGWSSLVGIACMVILLPIPGYIASIMQRAQRQRMKKTDARVQAVTETVNVLRMIKLFGWEQKMSERLDKTREDELKWLWKLKLLDNVNSLFGFVYPIMTMMVSYALYTLVMKETLTASKIFSSMSVFNMLREQLYRLLAQSMDIVQGKVSLERVEKFLHETELLDAFMEKPSAEVVAAPTLDARTEFGFKNATFTWSLGDEDDGTLTPSKREFKLRVEEELVFKKGGINLIVGPTGSGKTSILMALLGEMHYVPSSPDSWFNLPREGGIAYAAQESWVQNETIKNNILFQTPYDEVRYKKVLKQCALERDLELFEAGDATEVGERGLTLSGGQKARVTLARAIYSNTDILLLDDIFAALDVHTSSWIIENCFKGDLIQGRTVLLVTHNIALSSSIADFIVSVGSDGRVKTQGTEISAALKRIPSLQAEADLDQQATEIGQAELDLPPNKPVEKDGKLVVAEEVAEGHVTWKSFMLLIKNLGGEHPILYYATIVCLLLTFEWVLTFQSWFLGYWGKQYEGRDPSEVKDSFYIGAYTGLALFLFCSNFLVYLVYILGSLRASRRINRLLVDSILGSTLRWLDETPTARIITRCTQDIRAVDSTLPQTLMWLAEIINAFVTKLGAVVLFTPIFLFPGLGVAVAAFFIGNMYLKTQLSVKRESSNARAPVLSHFSAVIHGIVSIRAYGAQDSFRKESLTRIDRYTRLARLSWNLNRWIAVRMDFLGAAFTSGLAMYLLYSPNPIGASNTGFSLTMATEVAFFILLIVRIGNDFEVNANSLERIQSYIDIEHEPKPTESGKPPASWPTSGDLRVENLSARYSQNGPKVLNDISFHIESGQRVGIVGRTGSGKSSLTLSLLRCILTEGTVYYDGIPTNTINLDALRTNITIIPQTPELISGTLRQNLDPFDQHDDATLNDALQSAGLFSLQDEGEEGRLSLDSVISGGGANLSVGQRQIIALARAMVRGSKLLILDEATSAIDYKTDSIIQNTLRTELGGDVTVITVAHRLQTIMDSDKIMVLDGGRLVEFGTPKELLQHTDGLLRSLVDGSGDKDTLYTLAGVNTE